MTDEALIEKMAEAIYNTADIPVRDWANCCEKWPRSANAYRNMARAALSVVRDHEKMVQVGSTGAVRSTNLSAAKRNEIIGSIGDEFFEEMLAQQPGDRICELMTTTVKSASEKVMTMLESLYWPTVDRTSPPSSRDPNFPSSLLTRLEVPGGLTKGIRP